MTFAEKLIHHRAMFNLTQAQLSEILGVATMTESKWERGAEPTRKNRERILMILDEREREKER